MFSYISSSGSVHVVELWWKTHGHTHTHILQPSGLCPELPSWAGTRTNVDFTEARDSEWQWHQLVYLQICTSPQTDNHASTLPLSFLQARCPSYHENNDVKALKAVHNNGGRIMDTHTHNRFTVLWIGTTLCLGQSGWAGTRRNIHPLTPIVVINCPLSVSSI